jgi:MFS family permease
MVLATIASAAAAPLVFLGNFPLAVIGMACWGLGTGAQDSVMRATIARLAPQQRRATAFGIMNAVYGVAWFAGSVLLPTRKALIDKSPSQGGFRAQHHPQRDFCTYPEVCPKNCR